jgi:hypothetical protein
MINNKNARYTHKNKFMSILLLSYSGNPDVTEQQFTVQGTGPSLLCPNEVNTYQERLPL